MTPAAEPPYVSDTRLRYSLGTIPITFVKALVNAASD